MADNPMDLIGSILSNPEAMKSVGKMLSDLNLPQTAPTMPEASSDSTNIPDIAGMMNREDNGTKLLHALEPYLSAKRRGNINQIVQAVKVGRVIGTMTKKK